MDLEELKVKTFENAGEIIPLIHQLEDDVPDARKKEYVLWKNKINYLFDLYNKMSKFVAFKPIK